MGVELEGLLMIEMGMVEALVLAVVLLLLLLMLIVVVPLSPPTSSGRCLWRRWIAQTRPCVASGQHH